MRGSRAVSNVLGITIWLASLGFAEAQVIDTIAGGGPNNVPALSASVNHPLGVAVDSAGNLFIAASWDNRVFKVDRFGQITVVAGDGGWGSEDIGDGGLATLAKLSSPLGIAFDTSGNLFIAESYNRVRRVDAVTGIITTVAGNGHYLHSGDGGPATEAGMQPRGIALDAAGNLFIADPYNKRVRRVDSATGIITTVAGTGVYGPLGDGGPATAARLVEPTGVAADAAGNFFIADRGSSRIRHVDAATGTITTVAGTGSRGFTGDGGAATNARLNRPIDVALDAGDNFFIADDSNERIRRVDGLTGIITTIAGTGESGFSGDGGPATAALLDEPRGVALDAAGTLFIADLSNSRIRRVDSVTGIISTVAGNGTVGFSGDGSLAASASLLEPRGIALDSVGNLFISDSRNQRVRRVDAASGIITTIAGNGTIGFSGDGGPAVAAQLSTPYAVALDAADNLFIADYFNNRIRRIDNLTGIITTIAGNGSYGSSGDGGPATEASLNRPAAVAFDVAGNLFIADQFNHRIRRVDGATGTITTVAVMTSRLAGPSGVALDSDGNVFVAHRPVHRVRRVDGATGILTTVAGNGAWGFLGDGGPATAARLNLPTGVALDVFGNLFIADWGNSHIRHVDAATGIITSVAGSSADRGFSGDGGPATAAELSSPSGIALDAEGNFFISDFDNRRIRRVGEVIKATIDIDIKPDGTPNSINPTNEGVEPVAILGSETFDVSEVDGMTLIFGKDETAPIHDLGDSAVFADHLEDVNADGFADLVSHYATEESGIAFGDLTACLSGDTFDGAPFMGCDAVRTVPDMDGDGLLDPQEKSIGTNAFFKDSDGDGYEDGMEVLTLDSDPLDSLDPASGVTRKGPRRHKRRR